MTPRTSSKGKKEEEKAQEFIDKLYEKALTNKQPEDNNPQAERG